MASYRAEIQIGVVGIGQIGALQKSLNQVSKTVDILNTKKIQQGFNVQNINTYNTQLQKAWQNINKAAIGSQEELKAVQDLVIAKRNQVAVQERLNKLIKEAEASQKLPPSAGKGGGGVGGRLESIALGVGFPLLFGGGAGEVAGGLAGSFVGKGFGGQILGSAIGGIIDDFISKAGELGSALNPATANIDTLVKALGGATTSAGEYIAKLEELGRSKEALAVATEELKSLVGVEGVNAIKEFGQDTTQLQSVFTQAMTQMQASVASLINSSGILKALTAAIEYNVLLRQGLTSQDPRQQSLAKQREAAGGPILAGGDPQRFFDLNNKLVEQQRQINAEKEKQLELQTRILEKEEVTKLVTQELSTLKGASLVDVAALLQETEKHTVTLNTQKITHEDIKALLAQQRLELEANNTKYGEAVELVRQQAASLERGNQVTQSRYQAETALNDLYGAQLQRQYELATTAEERYNIAIKMFEQQVQAAKLEYEVAVTNNEFLVRKAELEARVVEIKYQQLEAEKQIALAQAETRGATDEQVQKISAGYDKALDAQQGLVNISKDQVSATREIADNQNLVADAVYKTKVIQAESGLAQKLVSKEIGLSKENADQLATSLGNGAYNANQMAGALGNVAQQARNAVVEISRIENVSPQYVTPQSGYEATYEYSDGTTGYANIQVGYAKGGYVTGPTRAMVGEGGESEYIIPASKMAEAMSRYASGQRGSSVIPSSINPQVNVTTGPVMNMDGSNYVSQNDFLAGMQTASRRGAEMALQMLSGSPQARRMVGIS